MSKTSPRIPIPSRPATRRGRVAPPLAGEAAERWREKLLVVTAGSIAAMCVDEPKLMAAPWDPLALAAECAAMADCEAEIEFDYQFVVRTLPPDLFDFGVSVIDLRASRRHAVAVQWATRVVDERMPGASAKILDGRFG